MGLPSGKSGCRITPPWTSAPAPRSINSRTKGSDAFVPRQSVERQVLANARHPAVVVLVTRTAGADWRGIANSVGITAASCLQSDHSKSVLVSTNFTVHSSSNQIRRTISLDFASSGRGNIRSRSAKGNLDPFPSSPRSRDVGQHAMPFVQRDARGISGIKIVHQSVP